MFDKRLPFVTPNPIDEFEHIIDNLKSVAIRVLEISLYEYSVLGYVALGQLLNELKHHLAPDKNNIKWRLPILDKSEGKKALILKAPAKYKDSGFNTTSGRLSEARAGAGSAGAAVDSPSNTIFEEKIVVLKNLYEIFYHCNDFNSPDFFKNKGAPRFPWLDKVHDYISTILKSYLIFQHCENKFNKDDCLRLSELLGKNEVISDAEEAKTLLCSGTKLPENVKFVLDHLFGKHPITPQSVENILNAYEIIQYLAEWVKSTSLAKEMILENTQPTILEIPNLNNHLAQIKFMIAQDTARLKSSLSSEHTVRIESQLATLDKAEKAFDFNCLRLEKLKKTAEYLALFHHTSPKIELFDETKVLPRTKSSTTTIATPPPKPAADSVRLGLVGAVISQNLNIRTPVSSVSPPGSIHCSRLESALGPMQKILGQISPLELENFFIRELFTASENAFTLPFMQDDTNENKYGVVLGLPNYETGYSTHIFQFTCPNQLLYGPHKDLLGPSIHDHTTHPRVMSYIEDLELLLKYYLGIVSKIKPPCPSMSEFIRIDTLFPSLSTIAHISYFDKKLPEPIHLAVLALTRETEITPLHLEKITEIWQCLSLFCTLNSQWKSIIRLEKPMGNSIAGLGRLFLNYKIESHVQWLLEQAQKYIRALEDKKATLGLEIEKLEAECEKAIMSYTPPAETNPAVPQVLTKAEKSRLDVAATSPTASAALSTKEMHSERVKFTKEQIADFLSDTIYHIKDEPPIWNLIRNLVIEIDNRPESKGLMAKIEDLRTDKRKSSHFNERLISLIDHIKNLEVVKTKIDECCAAASASESSSYSIVSATEAPFLTTDMMRASRSESTASAFPAAP